MAVIQILYDEKDKLPIPEDREGLSFAVLSLPTFYDEDELRASALGLVERMLRHHFGRPERRQSR